ncbi:MAG: sortase [Clostridiales bacterium]|nr:sortase [Clostridiales bacterium]
MRSKIGISCMILGAVLIISALLLLVYNRHEEDTAGKSVEALLPEVRGAIAENMQKAELGPVETEHINPFDEIAVEAAQEMTVVKINDSGYIGCLTIPVLELELPIRSELDNAGLKLAPCRMAGSYKSNDLVIAGHDYKRHFGRLDLLQVGDVLRFTDMDGVDIVYMVSEIEILDGSAVDEMLSGDWDMTLFTCTYTGRERLTIRCKRVEL